jgi:hypothetical protein
MKTKSLKLYKIHCGMRKTKTGGKRNSRKDMLVTENCKNVHSDHGHSVSRERPKDKNPSRISTAIQTCQASSSFLPATTERHHRRCVYIGQSCDQNRNHLLTWSVSKYFESAGVEKAHLHWSVRFKWCHVSTWLLGKHYDSAEVEQLSFHSIRLLPQVNCLCKHPHSQLFDLLSHGLFVWLVICCISA